MIPGAADWDPALYTAFEDERTRPARDLLARVGLDRPAFAVDLGCGPGNSTALLRDRFPEAEILGLDTSPAMLAEARGRLPDVSFVEADAAAWTPDAPPDLIFANASLQWVPDHPRLLPRLFGLLRTGGVLAVQVPDNLEEPSHRSMREVAAAGPWAGTPGEVGARRAKRVLGAADYYDLLAPQAAAVDIWRTTYQHPLPSAKAIVDWVRATGLRPFLDPLTPDERREFLTLYEARVTEAYPARADGLRLLAFPRLFLVARRKS